MLGRQSVEIGVIRIAATPSGSEVFWDGRQEVLTFRRDGHSVSFRLKNYPAFEADARRVDEVKWLTLINDGLKHLVSQHAFDPSPGLHEVLERFAFFFFRFQLPIKVPVLLSSPPIVLARLEIRSEFRSLEPNSYQSAWLLSLNNHIPFAERIDLLSLAVRKFELHLLSPSAGSVYTSSGIREREAYWWTIKSYYDLAKLWYESERSAQSEKALYTASLNYLQILKDEPRHQSLEIFLNEMGSSAEEEVKGVLQLKDNSVSLFKDDEIIKRNFTAWFLKRYNWRLASDLRQAPGLGKLSLILMLSAFGLFLLQMCKQYWLNDNGILPGPIGEATFEIFWGAQLICQLTAFVWYLLKSPYSIKLLYPKAVFGTLLAWTTVFFTALPDLEGFGFGKDTLMEQCECGKTVNIWIFLLVFFAFIVVLSSIFLIYFISQYTKSKRIILTRVSWSMVFLIGASVYWGMIFTLPAMFMLHKQDAQFMFHFDYSPICFFSVLLTGTMLAVFFGLLIHLIWQNESVAEPLGEPL